MKWNKLNLFKRLSVIEDRQKLIEYRLEKLYQIAIASCVIQNIHPKLLVEHSADMKSLAKYLVEMSNVNNAKSE